MRVRIVRQTRDMHHLREGTEHTVLSKTEKSVVIDGGYTLPLSTVEIFDTNPRRVTIPCTDIHRGRDYEWSVYRQHGSDLIRDLADLDQQGWEVVSSFGSDEHNYWINHVIRRAIKEEPNE